MNKVGWCGTCNNATWANNGNHGYCGNEKNTKKTESENSEILEVHGNSANWGFCDMKCQTDNANSNIPNEQNFQVSVRQFGIFNPISGKIWNDVIRQDRVNLTHKCFRLHKYPKQPQNGRNLFLDVHFDIYLAIESKITPK